MENNENMEKKFELKQVEVRLKVKASDPIYSNEPVDCAMKAVRLLSDFMKNMDREYVYILNFDTKMRPLSYSMVSMGGMSYAPIDPANIFKTALLSNAANMMIMHVHPSGDYTPSATDKEVTKRMVRAGMLIGIPVQDHLVVAAGTGEYYSMRLNMPELFTQHAEMEQSVAENGILQVHEDAADIDPKVYNKVIYFLERQQDLMQNTPEAWELAKEITILMHDVLEQEMDTRNYQTQKYIVESAEKIRDNNTDSLKETLATLGEKATSFEQAKEALSLIVKLSSYGEWEPAARETIKAFEMGTEAVKETAKQVGEQIKSEEKTELPKAISFSQKLEEKSMEAAEINAARTANNQLLDRPQGERQAI